MSFSKTGTFIMMTAVSACCCAAPVMIAENGKSLAPIVVPDSISAVDEFALQELKSYLKKASGADFSVIRGSGKLADGAKIYLGIPPKNLKLKKEERIVKTEGNNLYLCGSGYEGNLAAVYRFLERELGCRWWDAYGYEVIPERRNMKIDADLRWSEIMPYRSLMTFFHTKPNAHKFYARNGQNLLLGQDVTALNRIIPVGKGNHSLHKFVPPEKYFKSNPEFFSKNGSGERVASMQLCFSNPELRRTLTKNILDSCRKNVKKADAQGQENWIEVSVMDVTGSFCHCDGCNKLAEKYKTPGGAFFEYLPELCHTVKKEMPNTKISTLLYRKEQTEKPPVGITFPDNFVGIFAPIDDNIFAPLDHESNRETLEHLRTWCRIAGNIWVWYYPNTYGMLGPYSALRRTARDFKLMKEAGISGTFYEHDVTPPDSDNFSDLESWVILKLFSGAENPDLLTKEFINNYYGKASELMFAYFQEQEDLREKAVKDGAVGYYAASSLLLGYFSSANLEKWSKMFDRMEELVKNNDSELFRVRLVRRILDELILKKWDSFSEESSYAKKLTRNILRDRIVATLERMEKERRPYVSQKNKIRGLDSLIVQNVPQELKGIDPKRIRQVFYTNGTEDPEAVFGFAAQHTDLISFPYGMYANDYRSVLNGNKVLPKWNLQKNRFLEKNDVTADRFKLYKIGTFPITDALHISVTGHAYFFRSVGIFFTEKNPGLQWDVYLSLKFEGPAIPGSKAQKNRVLCDRIVLVKAE